ncbi:hypothetical protein LINPERPRIM_LOCUS5004 [Linum perenne]
MELSAGPARWYYRALPSQNPRDLHYQGCSLQNLKYLKDFGNDFSFISVFSKIEQWSEKSGGLTTTSLQGNFPIQAALISNLSSLLRIGLALQLFDQVNQGPEYL